MGRYNYISVSFFLALFICNSIIFAVRVLQDDFYESDSFFAALLQGMGFERPETEILFPIPRLMNISEDIFHGSNSLISSFDSKPYTFYISGWADTRIEFRKNFTIDCSQVNFDPTNFLILVDIYDVDLQKDAQASGNDISFTSSAGHLLDQEIEPFNRVYNSTHTHLVVWVRVPFVSNTLDTPTLIYYGNSAVPSQENPECVWNSCYLAVHSIEESPTSILYDSTNNGEDLTTQGSMTPGDLVNAQIGQGIDFDNSDEGAFGSRWVIGDRRIVL